MTTYLLHNGFKLAQNDKNFSTKTCISGGFWEGLIHTLQTMIKQYKFTPEWLTGFTQGPLWFYLLNIKEEIYHTDLALSLYYHKAFKKER